MHSSGLTTSQTGVPTVASAARPSAASPRGCRQRRPRSEPALGPCPAPCQSSPPPGEALNLQSSPQVGLSPPRCPRFALALRLGPLQQGRRVVWEASSVAIVEPAGCHCWAAGSRRGAGSPTYWQYRREPCPSAKLPLCTLTWIGELISGRPHRQAAGKTGGEGTLSGGSKQSC